MRLKFLTLFVLFISCVSTYHTRVFFNDASKDEFVKQLQKEQIKYEVRLSGDKKYENKNTEDKIYEVRYKK